MTVSIISSLHINVTSTPDNGSSFVSSIPLLFISLYTTLGPIFANPVGLVEGDLDTLGTFVGEEVGLIVGLDVGPPVGSVEIVGLDEGTNVGILLILGVSVGLYVGSDETLGDSDATRVGLALGEPLGDADGDVDMLG